MSTKEIVTIDKREKILNPALKVMSALFKIIRTPRVVSSYHSSFRIKAGMTLVYIMAVYPEDTL